MTGLYMDTTLTAEHPDRADTIRVSGEAPVQICSSVLDLSTIEAGPPRWRADRHRELDGPSLQVPIHGSARPWQLGRRRGTMRCTLPCRRILIVDNTASGRQVPRE
jgi:hypothetical protein